MGEGASGPECQGLFQSRDHQNRATPKRQSEQQSVSLMRSGSRDLSTANLYV